MFHRPFHCLLASLLLAAAATGARADDVAKGQRLAESHCAGCHAVGPQTGNVVAASPPFAVIARKYGFDAGSIATAIAGPHPKMNFSPSPTEAADIAAYIATLK